MLSAPCPAPGKRMVTREINNIGQPLRGPGGQPLGGIKIEFALVTIDGIPAVAIDTISHEQYIPVLVDTVTSPTNTDTLQTGEFQVNVWPTSRGDRQVFYKCTVKGLNGARTFIAPVPESAEPLEWDEFISTSVHIPCQHALR